MAELTVLENDANVGDAPVITITSAPARGTTSVLSNGTPQARVLWTDNGSGAGSTSFQYKVRRAEDGAESSATVNLTITANSALMPIFQELGLGDSRTSPANDLLPAYPVAGLVSGDIFLAHIVIHTDTAQACATPAGWTLVGQRIDADLGSFVFAKTAVGSESGSQAFNWEGTGGANPVAFALIYRYRASVSGQAVFRDSTVTAAGGGASSSLLVEESVALLIEDPFKILISNDGAIALFPGVPMAGTNRRALAFAAWNGRGTITDHPTGETGGDWVFRTGNSTTSGDDALSVVYDAAMAGGGTISGGTVTQNAGNRWCIIAFGIYNDTPVGQPPPSGYFISPTGNDTTGAGTLANPWQTLAKGMSVLAAGDRLNLRGGTYRLASAFTWNKSGTSSSRIVVASYPGEVAVLDANLSDFQTTGVGAWTLHDAATETYRSAVGYSDPLLWSGYIVIGGVNYHLFRYQTLTSLQSTVYTWRLDGEFYRGPGYMLHSDGRFYVRLQNLASPRDAGVPTDAPAGAAIRNTPPSAGGFNPNTFVINLSKVLDVFTVGASNVTFERLALHGGDRGAIFNGSNLTFQNCRVWGQRVTFVIGNSRSNLAYLGCDADNAYAPWISWNETKIDEVHHPGVALRFVAIGDNVNGALIQDCRIRSAFDGMTTPHAGTTGVRFLHNTWDFLFDDAVQFDGGTTDLEFGWNYVKGPGPGYNGGDGGAAATKYFHHNVLDVRRDEFGWRNGMESNNGGGTAWRRSHRAFPTHSIGSTDNTPAKIYNNTILIEQNISNTGAALQRVGAKTAGVHEVYNNIVLQYDDREYIREVTIGAADQILDYNLMWKYHAGSFELFNDWPTGSGGSTDYVNLTTWRASAGFTASKAVYAPGFEANSKQIDPVLGDEDAGDYRPTAAGAKTGAKDLSATGWPGATNASWFGAVDPDAQTGLGSVGYRGTPGP